MYSNIGSKIKALAKTVGAGLATIIIIIGIVASAQSGSFFVFLISVIVALIPIVLSYPMYGFGQLIESAMNIEKSLSNKCSNYDLTQPSSPGRAPDQREAGVNEWKCANCGTVNQNYVGTCGCGTQKP